MIFDFLVLVEIPNQKGSVDAAPHSVSERVQHAHRSDQTFLSVHVGHGRLSPRHVGLKRDVISSLV